MLKKFFRKLLPFIDIFFIPLLLVSAPIFKAFAALNGKKLPTADMQNGLNVVKILVEASKQLIN